MIFWWQTDEGMASYDRLKQAGVSSRLAGIMVSQGCDTVPDFIARFTAEDMKRMPKFGKLCYCEIFQLAEKANLTVRHAQVEPAPEKPAKADQSDNDLFLHCSHAFPDTVMLGIGTRRNKRTVTLSADEALKLAYRLMSLAKGGETRGFEKLERES